MEVQQNKPSDFPSWVVLDHQFRYEDSRFFRADEDTSAEVAATTGEIVRVAFTLHPLPGSSCLRFYCPKERKQYLLDAIVATHFDAVLFRYVVDFPDLPFRRRYALDYFLYRAGTSGPKLYLLPRCYSTEDEIMAATASDWRTKLRMWDRKSIGLLTAGEDFVVAELEFNVAIDSDAPLEAELFRLRSPSSQGKVGCQWELVRPKSRDGNSKVSFRDVLWWETHKVIPFSSYLCWIDYYIGILLCDVNHGSPDLQFIRFPVNDIPPSGPTVNGDGCPQLSRTVCVTKGETMMFITIDISNDTCSCKCGSDFSLIVWRLKEIGYSEYTWVEHFRTNKADELWAISMNGYDHNQYPGLVPEFPLVSMDEPHILYFVLRPAHVKTWIVTLDMESKTVLRCDFIGAFPSDGDAGMASYNIFGNSGFFPSEFSKYLKKLSTRDTAVLEKNKKKNKKNLCSNTS